MYKSYLEQGGKDGSLGHLVQNQIHTCTSLTLNREERKAVWVILFRRMVTLSWSISGVTSRTYRRQVAFTSFFPSDDKKMHCNLYSQDCQPRKKANCCSMEKEHCIFFSIFNWSLCQHRSVLSARSKHIMTKSNSIYLLNKLILRDSTWLIMCGSLEIITDSKVILHITTK